MRFPSPRLPHQIDSAPHIPPVQIQPVAMLVMPRDRLAIKLVKQNMRQRFGHRRGRAFQQIGNRDRDPAAFQTDAAVGIHETACS